MAIAGEKNESGSAVPKGDPPNNVTEKAAERNVRNAGGKDPLQEPIGEGGARANLAEGKEKEEGGPCGLPKKCSIL